MKVVIFRKIDTCFGLSWSTLICLGLLALFLITTERLKCSKAISGMGLGLEISVGTDSNNKSAQRLLELCFIYLTQDSATAAIDSKTLEIKASTAER